MNKHNWESSAFWGLFRISDGWSAAAWTAKGLSALVLPQKKKFRAFQKLQEYLPTVSPIFWKKPPVKVPKMIQKQTSDALAGKPFRLNRFDVSFLTLFQQRILRATCQIPWGQTRSYGWVAQKAGSPRGYRAAGQALTRNPVPVFIPCHRVIAGGGRLGGYGGGLDWKIRLLNNEGAKVREGRVVWRDVENK